MMNNTAKVIQLNVEDDKNVWGCLDTFLTRVGQNSKNTRNTYERAIRDFFMDMRGKKIEDLVEKDLIFTKNQVESYQVRLKEKFKGTTVNTKMSALKKTYMKFEDYGFDVRATWFDVDRYSEHEKESYDSMTFDEVMKAIELIKETRKGEEKALFIEVAFVTAFRKESLKTISMNSIYKHNDGEYVVEVIDKGNKKSKNKISKDLYERLYSFAKSEGKGLDESIFVLTNKTIRGMMDHIRENIDFGKRRIVFHSLKKASIEEVALQTGYDLKAMQAQGHHASVQTTLDHYMTKKTVDDMQAVDMYSEAPVEEFELMSKEELVEMLNNAPRDIQIKLLRQEGKMD